MEELIESLKQHVINQASQAEFIHHDWYVQYHLEIVERIALELCDRYPEANREMVQTLVWIHDYAKILDKEHEDDARLLEVGYAKLLELGFTPTFADLVLENLRIFEMKMEIDLRQSPIEVQIVSSADGAAHLVGPFWMIYHKENAHQSIDALLAENQRKLKKDWERKIVLPVVRAAFLERHRFVTEQTGIFPEKFL